MRKNAVELQGRLVPDMLKPGSNSLPAFSRQTCTVVLGEGEQLSTRAFGSMVWQLNRAAMILQELFRNCRLLSPGVLYSCQRMLSAS